MDDLNPASRSNNVSSIVLLSGGYLLLRLVVTEGLISTIAARLFSSLPDFIFYSFTFLIPLPALVLLWYMKKPGYILTLICTAYIVTGNLTTIFKELNAAGRGSFMNGLFLFLPCIVYGYVLYLICAPDVYKAFIIKKWQLLILIAAGILPNLIFY